MSRRADQAYGVSPPPTRGGRWRGPGPRRAAGRQRAGGGGAVRGTWRPSSPASRTSGAWGVPSRVPPWRAVLRVRSPWCGPLDPFFRPPSTAAAALFGPAEGSIGTVGARDGPNTAKHPGSGPSPPAASPAVPSAIPLEVPPAVSDLCPLPALPAAVRTEKMPRTPWFQVSLRAGGRWGSPQRQSRTPACRGGRGGLHCVRQHAVSPCGLHVSACVYGQERSHSLT